MGSLVHQTSGYASENTVCANWNNTNLITGSYLVTVSFSNDCQEISNTYALSLSSCAKLASLNNDEIGYQLDELSKAEDSLATKSVSINVFPNPTKGNFTLEVIQKDIKPYSLEIINSTAIKVYMLEHLNSSTLEINQQGLPSGVYYIRVSTGLDYSSKKIIIQ